LKPISNISKSASNWPKRINLALRCGGAHGAFTGALGTRLIGSSKTKADFDFFELLCRVGQRAAWAFLERHFDDLGQPSTFDLAVESGVDWA
jgi:hypothetical protein